MIKNFFDYIKKINHNIKEVMIHGFKISFIILLFSCYILFLYNTYPFSHVAYLSGLYLFKLAITCFSAFFTCGIATNRIIE